MVHQYQLNGYNIVLDTCSGAIHVVDEVAYDIIALYPDHTADEIVTAMMEKYGAREDVTEQDLRDCIEDVEALKQAGKLYTPDTFADMAGTFKERSGDVVKALCLHVAHTCNLNCSYCFAAQGTFHGEAGLMSFETGKMCCQAEWPVYAASKTVASTVEMAIQVNGKMKGTVTMPVDSDEETIKAAALAVDKVQKATAGMQIVKTILVKHRLINLTVKPQ